MMLGRELATEEGGFPFRLAAVGFSIPVHGVLGLVIPSMSLPTNQPPLLQNSAAFDDQRLGGWMLWVAGNLVLSGLLVATVLTWAADEEHRGAGQRSDPLHGAATRRRRRGWRA